MTTTVLPDIPTPWTTDALYAAPVDPHAWESSSGRISTNAMKPAPMPTGSDVTLLGYLGRGGPCARLDLLVHATPVFVGTWVVGLAAAAERMTPPFAVVVEQRITADGTRERVLPAPAPELAPLTAGAQIGTIQEYLSLQMSQVAEILGVTRKTAYGYLNESVLIPKDERTAARLRALHQLALEWSQMASVPLGRMWSLRIDEDTPSLIDQLIAPEWNWERLRATVQLLAAQAQERVERQRVMRERGFSLGRDTGPEDRELRRLDDALRRIR